MSSKLAYLHVKTPKTIERKGGRSKRGRIGEREEEEPGGGEGREGEERKDRKGREEGREGGRERRFDILKH